MKSKYILRKMFRIEHLGVFLCMFVWFITCFCYTMSYHEPLVHNILSFELFFWMFFFQCLKWERNHQMCLLTLQYVGILSNIVYYIATYDASLHEVDQLHCSSLQKFNDNLKAIVAKRIRRWHDLCQRSPVRVRAMVFYFIFL